MVEKAGAKFESKTSNLADLNNLDGGNQSEAVSLTSATPQTANRSAKREPQSVITKSETPHHRVRTPVNPNCRPSIPIRKHQLIPTRAVNETVTETINPVERNPTELRTRVLHLEKLVHFLDKEFQPIKQKMADLLKNNDINFSLLWCLFKLGSDITFKDTESGLICAGEVCISPTKHSRVLI